MRAYLGFEITAKTRISLHTPTTIQTEVGFRNFGQTPAYDVIFEANLAVGAYPLKVDLPPITKTSLSSRATLHKTEVFATSTVLPEKKITDQEVAMLTTKPVASEPSPTRIYLYGNLTYRDIFGEKHVTNFRCVSDGNHFVGDSFYYDWEGNNAT